VPLGYRVTDKKVVVVPEEATTVRSIFTRYLELGSIGALIEDLERKGIRTKTLRLADGRVRGGIRFGTGALAHLLKNRFFIGEVVYRGATHQGGHPIIVDRELFEAVQTRLAENAVGRRTRLRGSPSLLAGRIFEDRGNRMSLSHTRKDGVRYRYYVSQAILRQRKGEVGSVARVPAAEIEQLVLACARAHQTQDNRAIPDRDLIEQRVHSITVRAQGLDVKILVGEVDSETSLITLPWTAPSFAAVKGIVHTPSAGAPALKPETREALLSAIAKARRWIDDLRQGRRASFAEIARQEGQVERHIRLLAPLAFVSPRIVSAIVGGTAPADLTVTGLARALPHSWTEQARTVGLR
jgi:hypothetical protein